MRSATSVAATLLAFVCAGTLAASAPAATYTVGTLSDLTGTCADPAAGTCSLRQLVEYENGLVAHNPTDTDTIVVPGGKYSLLDGALVIKQSLAIVGAGARTTDVDDSQGIPQERVFDIQAPNGEHPPSVFISGLEISGGTATEANGSFGGDVLNSASLVLEEDWITNGTASSGGGISNNGGTLLLERSLVSVNHASSGGGDSGGIQNHGTAVCGTTCVPGKKALLAVDNSTIADNDARLGAGIFSWSDAADGNEVTIVDSTIAYNTTKEESGGPARGPGAGLLVSDGQADVTGSIFAFNEEINEAGNFTATNCSTSGAATIASAGYNLESGIDCGFKSTGDLQETSPGFNSSEPQNNGGNTDTLALEPTSPAIDAIPAGNPLCGGADQRGVTRPQGAGCDIGAFELVPFTVQAVEGAPFSGQVTTSPSCGLYSSPAPTIEWGDGQTSPGTVSEAGSFVLGTHTYAEEGTFSGSVTYHNDCGAGTHTVAFQADVADAPLTAAVVPPVSASAGAQFNATVATFTDADPAGTASDYTATIDWGDGSNSAGTIVPAPGGGFTVTGSHTYGSGGSFQINVAIDDVGGATATATTRANVTAAPPPPPSPAPPSLQASAPPSVLSTTSAAFSATVNPHGLPTTVHFEYGGVFGGASVAAVTYGSTTPNQSVPADFANHTVTTTVTSLLPNVLYHVRAVATNSAGSAQGADQILTTPADPPPPPPVLGKSVNVTPISGIVYVELPPGAKLSAVSSPAPGSSASSPFAPFSAAFAALGDPRAFSATAGTPAHAALTKGSAFIPLTEARQIPVNSILDTTAGVVGITTATTASRHGKLQSGDFGAGLFKLLQGRHQHGLTNLDIIDTHSARQLCATQGKSPIAAGHASAGARIAAAHPSSKVLGRLNASGHGHFSAHGQYSAATVRGTVWSVANQCNGTLTRVKRGVISVRDFSRRRTFTLFTGQSYLARAPHA